MKHLFCIFLSVLIYFSAASQQLAEPNYDEEKVPAYTLPEILTTRNNIHVNTKAVWESQRRPEILKLFEENVYGRMPNAYDSLNFVTVNSSNALNGRAYLKQVNIEIFRKNKSVVIHLILFIPTSKTSPAPVFLFINNRDKENTDPTRKTKSDFWPVELVVDSGYAMATFHVSDVAPDNKDSFMNGALQLYPEQIKADNGMRAIGAWAWGASRVMDYIQEDSQLDGKKVTIAGHSRGGKAALWAAAQDERFAMCISNCSGNSGMALSRRRFGETVAMINTSFPHWFTTNYKKYNNNEQALPVDQHMLVSLIAPRPVYATNASKDLWADPTGTFLSLQHAEEVYELYGVKSSLPIHPPGINQPIYSSRLAYHNREGIHDLTTYDWRRFIEYANLYFVKNAQ